LFVGRCVIEIIALAENNPDGGHNNAAAQARIYLTAFAQTAAGAKTE